MQTRLVNATPMYQFRIMPEYSPNLVTLREIAQQLAIPLDIMRKDIDYGYLPQPTRIDPGMEEPEYYLYGPNATNRIRVFYDVTE